MGRRIIIGIILQMFVFSLVVCVNAQEYEEIKISWWPNKEADLDGYNIYYSVGQRGGPYDGTGILEGDSPIVVYSADLVDVNDPYTILHIPKNNIQYFFVGTAFDKEGNESGESWEVYYPVSISESLFSYYKDENRWTIVDDDPGGAYVHPVFDDQKQGEVIETVGAGYDNSYRLKAPAGYNWLIDDKWIIQWSVRTTDTQACFYVVLETIKGARYMQYKFLDYNELGSQTYIKYGLGSGMVNDRWHTFTRNLQADLEYAQPGNAIIKVNGFIVRGNVRLDDIEMLEDVFTAYYSLGNNTGRWVVQDHDPGGAYVYSDFDPDLQSMVIITVSAGSENSFWLKPPAGYRWGNSVNSMIQWKALVDDPETQFFVVLNTTIGDIFLQYVYVDHNEYRDDTYIKFGLCEDLANGYWQTFTRNVYEDFESAGFDAQIISVDGFIVRGNASIDNVKMYNLIESY